jgi:hypothetical protein
MEAMEKRICALEASVFSNKSQTPIMENLESRLQHLIDKINSQVPHSHVVQVQSCSKLSQELAPSGLILNYPTMALDPTPLIYRKQEVLARYDQFKFALEQLAQIREYLLISNPKLAKDLQNTSEGGTKVQISLDHIASAPIIITEGYAFASDEKNVQRLDHCIQKALIVNQKVHSLVERVDVLVERYSNAIQSINEKMALLQDDLC